MSAVDDFPVELDRKADFPDVERLVRPNGVAVAGASPDKSKSVGGIIPLLEQGHCKGAIYPVNPKYGEICGHRTFARPSEEKANGGSLGI